MSEGPALRVVAALLAQGQALHLTAVGLTLAAVLAGPGLVGAAAVAVVGLETLLAVRVGLDARLFDQLASGLEPADLDRGLVAAGLRREAPDRPVRDRIAGALRLLGIQAALVAAEGALVGLALLAGR